MSEIQPNDDTPEQIKLLRDIAELLRNPKAEIPWDRVLWTPEEVANYLRVSPRTAAEKYAPRPDFPKARHPGGGYARWMAHEIVDWAENCLPRKRGR